MGHQPTNHRPLYFESNVTLYLYFGQIQERDPKYDFEASSNETKLLEDTNQWSVNYSSLALVFALDHRAVQAGPHNQVNSGKLLRIKSFHLHLRGIGRKTAVHRNFSFSSRGFPLFLNVFA